MYIIRVSLTYECNVCLSAWTLGKGLKKNIVILSTYQIILSDSIDTSFNNTVTCFCIFCKDTRLGIMIMMIPYTGRRCFFYDSIKTCSGACQILWTQGPFPRGKVAGAWSWPLTSLYCQCKLVFMVLNLIKHKDNFTFTNIFTEIVLV
jgi:hypothetical protein